MKYVKPEQVSLKNHPEFNELWMQERIAEDPSLLGLGELILRDRERIHSRAGRLDLLLQDEESNHRYEVELQLGKTDEAHLIRTIEYWDIERKRYPQYEHTAVIVAEDITSRFLNVISLFNGFIPLIAIQVKAFRIGEQVSLVFTTVLDKLQLGLDEDDETEVTDRKYWEKRGSKMTLAMADELLEMIRTWNAGLTLKYTKFYIGLAKEGQPSNFVIFRPKKDWLRLEPRLEQRKTIQTMINKEEVDDMGYDRRWGRYRIRLSKGDIKKHERFLREFLRMAYDEAGG